MLRDAGHTRGQTRGIDHARRIAGEEATRRSGVERASCSETRLPFLTVRERSAPDSSHYAGSVKRVKPNFMGVGKHGSGNAFWQLHRVANR
jgi:hypothetical protein